MPRLLVMASTFPAAADDGTPAFIRDLAIEESAEFDVTVLVPRVPGAPSEEWSQGVRIRRFAYFPRRWEDLAHGAIIENLRAKPSRWLQVIPFFVAETFALLRARRELKPDVLHVHWIIPQAIVARLAGGRVPRIVTTLGGDLYALNGGPLRRIKSWAIRSAHAVTVMNAEMAALVQKLGARRTVIAPMGADLDAVRPIAQTRGKRPAGPLRLLFVGRLVEKKGLAILLDALRTSSIDATLTVVGDGPLRQRLEVAAEGMPVRFIGQLGRSALAAEYGRHDVVVTPSVLATSGDKDGLPVALLEAMGAGCAIVASRLPGIDEAIVDGENGRLFESGDVAALTRCLTELASSPGEVERLGRAAAERALDFSTTRAGERYRGLLRDALAE